MEWKVTDDVTELLPGIYPVLICYDPHEGFFPDGAAWDGVKWSKRAVAYFLDEPCSREDEAKSIAYENDPDW